MEEDEELKVIIPKGIKHLEVSERRSAKNIKEILAPSTFAFHPPQTETSESANNFEMSEDLNENGCFPCGKGCIYCALLAKSQGNTVRSISNGRKYKIRQRISFKSKNIAYVVTCKKCKLQGVGHSIEFHKGIANYFSHIKSNTRDCEIICHFIDNHEDTWIENYALNEEFLIEGIVQLENPPRAKKAIKGRLINFEGYWQHQLGTIYPLGMNVKDEMKDNYNRS